jgi:hypothetical protein
MKNFANAGLSEQDRVNILERTRGGIIANAKDGLAWNGSRAVGRSFIWTDKRKRKGYWKINERGKKIKRILERYVQGESMRALTKEFGISSPQIIYQAVRNGQLAGVYEVVFTSKEKDLDVEGLNEPIPVPVIPEVISPELERKVKERLEHNRRFTKKKEEYPLSGFLYCDQCTYALTGQTVLKREGQTIKNRYKNYRHNRDRNLRKCSFCGVAGDKIEPVVLDYLFQSFLDEPAYTKAIKAAMPSDEDRKAAEEDLKQVEKQQKSVNMKLANISDEIEKGDFDRSILLPRSNKLTAEKEALERRRDELQETLDNMPDPKVVEREARAWKKYLRWKIRNRDWRILPCKDIQEYLHFLFSENPKKNGFGIFVDKKDGQWHITFKGRFESDYSLVDGKRIPNVLLELQERFEHINKLKEKVATPDVFEKYEKDYRCLRKEYVQELEQYEELKELIGEAEGIQSHIELYDFKIERLEKGIEFGAEQNLKPKSGNELHLPISRSK